MKTIVFTWLIIRGFVIPSHTEHQGNKLYTLDTKDGNTYTKAYRSEILQWRKTKVFKYADCDMKKIN